MTEAYQRSALIGFSNDCGSGILQPVLAENCPSEAATLELPECQSGLGQGELCEADFEARSDRCRYRVSMVSVLRLAIMAWSLKFDIWVPGPLG